MTKENLESESFESPPLEELDRLLNGYKFESFIAKGGMGSVYMARQTSLDREVAVKVLSRELCENEEFIASFQSEAKLMAKFNNPNLISIYDFGNIDGMLYIIMEFVRGKSLHHSANGKAINQAAAVEIISSICSGLDHAHQAGILHRDIKPANILLGKGAVPKIGDFGLARVNGATESGTIYGTPGYTAPEVLNAPEKVDARTDIFAVGVMFYELLAGRMPPTKKYVSVTQYVDVDPRFDKIIKKAIHPNIELRYRSAKDFADDLNEVIANPQASNKLIVSASKKKTALIKKPNASSGSASGAKLLSSASKLNLASSSPGVLASVASVNPVAPKVQTTSEDSKMIRNTAIIFLLLIAIYAILEMQDDKKKVVNAQQREEEEIAEEKKKIEDQKAAERAAARKKAAAERAAEEARIKESSVIARPMGSQVSKDNLSPLEKLALAREFLGDGKKRIGMLPETIFTRDKDSRLIMFVDKKMTWDAADKWARELGGYISVCKSRNDLSALAKRIPEGVSEVWLGAGCSGDKGWSWIDDTPWTKDVSLKASYNRVFAKLSSLAMVGRASGSRELNFFIEWRADKNTNPAELEYRLQRASDTLSDVNPKYPPGSITLGSRTYCIIKEKMDYFQASLLAATSGGHLLAISNEEEKMQIEGLIKEHFKSGKTIWTSGEKNDGVWRWSTCEDWLKFKGDTSALNSGNRMAVSVGESFMLKDKSEADFADAFIIEWSSDHENVNIVTSDINRFKPSGGLKALNEKAKLLVTRQRFVTNKKHDDNVRKLWLDLKNYLGVLPRGQRADAALIIEPIIEQVKDEVRIPYKVGGQGSSTRSRGYTSQAVEKQTGIDFTHEKQMNQLRENYLKQLKKIQLVMEDRGEKERVKSLQKEVIKIGQTAEEFEDYFDKL